jgi:hypothetical protein
MAEPTVQFKCPACGTAVASGFYTDALLDHTNRSGARCPGSRMPSKDLTMVHVNLQKISPSPDLVSSTKVQSGTERRVPPTVGGKVSKKALATLADAERRQAEQGKLLESLEHAMMSTDAARRRVPEVSERIAFAERREEELRRRIAGPTFPAYSGRPDARRALRKRLADSTKSNRCLRCGGDVIYAKNGMMEGHYRPGTKSWCESVGPNAPSHDYTPRLYQAGSPGLGKRR